MKQAKNFGLLKKNVGRAAVAAFSFFVSTVCRYNLRKGNFLNCSDWPAARHRQIPAVIIHYHGGKMCADRLRICIVCWD